MAEGAEPSWQDNYVDLGDDANIRFGGECVVCQARFATIAVPIFGLGPDTPATAGESVDEQKFAAFAAFDNAFRSILIPCFRCGNLACPECWDVDKQMCGACVAERGLVRSPHRGGPVEGPLADGYLRRIEPGRYSEAGRPTWLKELLRAQADPPAARSLSSGSLSIEGLANQAAVARQPAGAPDLSDSGHLRAPALPFNPQQFDTPTYKMPAAPVSTLPQPSFQATLNGNEGEATASLIACPQCGTRNYDFVTQCARCGLQLIQVCPRCEQLNPGHVRVCESCGAPMDRPSGWTTVRSPVLQLQQADYRRKVADAPTQSMPLRDQPNKRPVNNSAALTSAQMRQRTNYATPTVAAEPALAVVPASVAAFAASGEHPYAAAMGETRATKGGRHKRRTNQQRSPVLGIIGLVIERLLTIILILSLIALIAITVAAEKSPAANHWLTLTLHTDVKSHIDRFLYWLQNQVHFPPQS